MTGSWKGRGNQYIEFVRVLYCKLTTNGKQLPAFSLEAVPGIEPRPQRWEARVLPLHNRGPFQFQYYNWYCLRYLLRTHSCKRDLFPFIWGFMSLSILYSHITMSSWKGRGNQYIQLVNVLYCKLPTNGTELPVFHLRPCQEPNPGLRGGRRECYHSATVAPVKEIKHTT